MKNKNKKFTKINLALAGLLPLLASGAYADPTPVNCTETTTGSDLTYSCVAGSSGSTYLEKDLTLGSGVETGTFTLNGSTLEISRTDGGDRGAVNVKFLPTDTASQPKTVNFNLTDFTSIKHHTENNARAVYLSVGETNGTEKANSTTNITGDATRSIEAVVDTTGLAIGVRHQFDTEGDHVVNFEAENTTVTAKATVKGSSGLYGFFTESSRNGNTIVNLKKGTVNVDADGKSDVAKGIYTLSRKDTVTNKNVEINVSGGTVKALNAVRTIAVDGNSDLINTTDNTKLATTVNLTGGTLEAKGGTVSNYGVKAVSFTGESVSGEAAKATVHQTADSTVTVDGSNAVGFFAEARNKGNAVVNQEGGVLTVTGDNSKGVEAKSTSGEVNVTLAGTVDAKTVGLETSTAAGKTSTITLADSAKLYGDTLISNGAGDSIITVGSATLGKADHKGALSLGEGADNLTLTNTDLTNVTTVDGGQDTDVNTDFDTLELTGYNNLDLGNRLKNWERVELKAGTYSLSNNLTVGSGTSTADPSKVGGLEVDNGSTLTVNSTVTGDVSNKGTLTLSANSGVSGTLSNEGTTTVAGNSTVTTLDNKSGATVEVNAALTGTVTNHGTVNLNSGSSLVNDFANDGTVNVKGDSTVTTLTNKDGATVNVNAKLTGNLTNQGTASLATGSEVEGTVDNEKTLTLADGSKVTGDLNNKAAGTATLNGATITGALNNESTATVAGDTTVSGGVSNKENATLNVNSTLRAALDNKGTATLNNGSDVIGTVNNEKTITLANGSKVTGDFNNKAAGTATLNGTTVTLVLNNEGTVTVDGNTTVSGGVNNKAGATLNVNADLATVLNNVETATVNLSNTTVDGTVYNSGTVNVTGNTAVNSNLNNDATGTLNVSGQLTGDVHNEGTTNLTDNAVLVNAFTNEGTVKVQGSTTVQNGLTNEAGKTVNVNAQLTGDLTNKGTANLNANSSVVGSVTNQEGATATLNQTTVATLDNEGTVKVTGDSTVTTLNNKADATAILTAGLNGNLNNEGTANLNAGANLDGTLANKAGATATLDQATVRTLENEGTVTVAGASTVTTLNNKADATALVNSDFTGTLNNEGTATVEGVTFTGDLVNSGTTTLNSGLNLTGLLTNNAPLTVNGDVAVGNLTNNNLVDLRSATADQYNTLTVEGDLNGKGTVKVNTKLDGADSKHDTLHVKGNVHGTTVVEVTTVGDGTASSETIEAMDIVKLEDGSTVDNKEEAFKLLNVIESGAYEYNSLVYDNSVAGKAGFYLRSTPQTTTSTTDKDAKVLRPAVAAYAINQQVNTQAINNLTTNLHQRKGEQRVDTNYLNPRQSWVRVLSNQNHLQANNLKADSGEYGVQIGWDFNTLAQGKNRTGLYGAYSKVEAKVGDNYRLLSSLPGKVDTDLVSLGLYNTLYFGQNYFNSVLAFNYLHSNYEFVKGGSQNALGGAASLEAGSSFALANNFFFEPQIQVAYQFTHYKDFSDALTTVKGFNNQSLRPRVGFRLGYHDVQGTNVWFHANVEFEVLKPAKFLVGADTIATERAARALYDLGLNGQLALGANTVLYVSAQYRESLDKASTLSDGTRVKKSKFRGFGAEAGLRFTW